MEELSKEGIVAVLVKERTVNEAGSVRRTLSANMASEKLLNFHLVKKKSVNSYGSDSSSSSSESEEEWERNPCLDDVLRNIIHKGKREKTDTFASELPPPYAVKRSEKVMSDKSLGICTEPLGSETGAECCFSCYSCSRIVNGVDDGAKVAGVKQNSHFGKNRKSSPPDLPPPLTSISSRYGTTLCINSRREKGRLVIDAVPETSRNRLLKERRDGCLVISLERTAAVQKLENNGGGANLAASKNILTLPSGIHKLVVKRLVTIGNKNPKMMTETEKNILIPESVQSTAALLIPQPPLTPPSSFFNAYEYFWRSKSAAARSLKISSTNAYSNSNIKWNENHEEKMGNKEEYLLPYFKHCKETRRRSIQTS